MNQSGLCWSKSTYSSAQGDDCVEVAVAAQDIHLRDSKDVTRPHLVVSPKGWARFLRYVAGE
jgi:hypothetical protein